MRVAEIDQCTSVARLRFLQGKTRVFQFLVGDASDLGETLETIEARPRLLHLDTRQILGNLQLLLIDRTQRCALGDALALLDIDHIDTAFDSRQQRDLPLRLQDPAASDPLADHSKQ